MTRSISIWYETTDGAETNIPIDPPYDLLGTQDASKQFWSNPRLKEIGVRHLSELGTVDPVTFEGWDMMEELGQELLLLLEHFPAIEFHVELKARWLAHLMYCYCLLRQGTPPGCIPCLMIG